MRVTMINANIRGCERKTNKHGEDYLVVRVEDQTGKPAELIDKGLDREKYYKRDMVGNIELDIQTTKYTTIRIVDFKIVEDKFV